MTSTVSIGELFVLRKGKKPPELFETPREGSRPFHRIGELRGETTSHFAVDSSGTEVNESDLCIVWDGANAGTVGYGLNGLIGSTITRLRPKNPKKVFTPYAGRFLQSKFALLNGSVQGAAIPHVDGNKLKLLELPLPSIKEQKRISAILDQADAIRSKRKQAIQLADDFLRSSFFNMFGDPATNCKQFEIRKLNEFYISEREGTKCGPFGSALKKHEYTQSGIPVWNMDNISLDGKFVAKVKLWVDQDKFEDLLPYSTKNGDVLISRAGTVGKMCVLEHSYEKSLISTNLIRVRFNTELLPIFFVSLMNYCKGRVGRLKTGPDGSFTHMNTGILDKLVIPYPPLKLQKRYKRVVERVNNMLGIYEISSNQYNELFDSLSQRAFRGEL